MKLSKKGKSIQNKLDRSCKLLNEIMSEDFFALALWDFKEARRWKRKADRLLESEGWIEVDKPSAVQHDAV